MKERICIDLQALSGEDAAVRRLTEADVEQVYALCIGNPLYYEYHPPVVTRDAVRADMNSLPPGMAPEDKYFIGFFQQGCLFAIMDLISGYPERDIAFIGLFMVDSSCQTKGVGTALIRRLCAGLRGMGFRAVRLAWIDGNPQSEHFWRKNRFTVLKKTDSLDGCACVLAQREL